MEWNFNNCASYLKLSEYKKRVIHISAFQDEYINTLNRSDCMNGNQPVLKFDSIQLKNTQKKQMPMFGSSNKSPWVISNILPQTQLYLIVESQTRSLHQC